MHMKTNAAPNATAGEPIASSSAISAGPAVNENSMSTPSRANATRRADSSSKRWRHIVRVSTEIGGEKAPATPATIHNIGVASPSGFASHSTSSAAGQTMPVTSSATRGPWRSIQRPMNGALVAEAPRYAPTAAPAAANDPVSARTCSSIASVTVPSGIRASTAIARRRETSGSRKNHAYCAAAAWISGVRDDFRGEKWGQRRLSRRKVGSETTFAASCAGFPQRDRKSSLTPLFVAAERRLRPHFSVDDLHVLGRKPLTQPLDQRIIGGHTPRFGQVELAADACVDVAHGDRQRARTERTQDLLEPIGRRVAVARDAQRLRPAFAHAAEIVDVLGDDAQPLRLAIVGHPLHHADLHDHELVLAQQRTRGVERLVVDHHLGAAL